MIRSLLKEPHKLCLASLFHLTKPANKEHYVRVSLFIAVFNIQISCIREAIIKFRITEKY